MAAAWSTVCGPTRGRRSRSRREARPARTPSRTSAPPRHSDTARQARAPSMRWCGARNSTYASSSTTTVSVGTRRRNRSISAADSTVPVGLCGRHTTTTRAFAAASAMASRSWCPCVIERNRDRLQPGHLGEDRISVERRRGHHHLITRIGNGVQHLHDHAGSADPDDDLLVAHTDMAGDQRSEPIGQELRIPVTRVDRGDQRGPNRRQWRKRDSR